MSTVRQDNQSDKKPAISVIVPGYNVEDYLKRCLDSILSQEFTDFEVILVDDGSTDNTLEIFEHYLTRFPRAKLIHQHNQGLSKARNAGIEVATGDYIGFIDSDDWIAPTMLKTLHSAITETKSDIAQVGYEACSDPHYTPLQPVYETRRVLDPNEALCEMFIEEKYSVWCRLYARHLIEGDEEVFPAGLTSEDRVANFKLMIKAQRIVVSDRIEYFYFLNYGSISYSGLDRRGFDLLEADERIMKMAKEYGNTRVLELVEDRAAKGSFSLLVKWARFGITDPQLEESKVAALKEQYRKDYPRLMASQLSAAKKFVAWQLRYMPRFLKTEFKLYNALSGHRKERS